LFELNGTNLVLPEIGGDVTQTYSSSDLVEIIGRTYEINLIFLSSVLFLVRTSR